jgi:Cu-processing system permease protein
MTTWRILRYQLRDAVRSRALILYGVFFLVATELLVRFSGDRAQALLSLANLTLLVVPLVSLVLGTTFVYNAREFTELLLSQPVNRPQLFAGLYLGVAAPLIGGFLLGVGIPVVVHGLDRQGGVWTVALLGVAATYLTAIFTAIAFAIALRSDDRLGGIGLALGTWLFVAVVWDALVLFGANAFYAYPLERPLLVSMLLNPVDLARVVLMLNFDVAALMGYTGTVFRSFFGSALGLAVALAALTVWLLVPLSLGLRRFARKDF